MKILFIGNSHTYMNDMPELTRRMIEDATGVSCEVFMLAYSSRSLKWHIEEEYFSERDCEWYYRGTMTRDGNPRHPSYIKSGDEYRWFPVCDYAANWRYADVYF